MTPEIKTRIDQIRCGEVPEGYHREKNWIIPNLWKIRNGNALFSFIRNGFVGTVTPYYVSTGIRYLQGTNIKSGKIISDAVFYVTESFHEAHPNSKLRSGDVVVVQSGAVGECAVVNKEFDGGNCHALIIMTPKKTTDSIWFANVMNSTLRRNLLAGIITGNTIHHILASDMKKISVPTPSYSEQQRISEILTVQDKIIELKEKRLAEKQRQKKCLMQQLLTGKKRLPGFSDKWRSERLGELFAERIETKCAHLELLSITGTQGVIPRKEIEQKDNSSEDKSKYLRICVGDIGYNTMRMWQGVSAYSNYEGIVSPAYTILTPKKSINAKYFAYLFVIIAISQPAPRYSPGYGTEEVIE